MATILDFLFFSKTFKNQLIGQKGNKKQQKNTQMLNVKVSEQT